MVYQLKKHENTLQNDISDNIDLIKRTLTKPSPKFLILLINFSQLVKILESDSTPFFFSLEILIF